MPTTPRKARKLIEKNKAKIISYEPFTIQLLYATGETKQPVSIGIDLGAKHVGVAIQSENKVISKGEIELRDDIKNLIETRKIYRRSRRNRKTRYRKPRFDNRKRPNNWLPPSIQSRINNTFMWIDRFMDLVPNPTLNIEVGKFDVQKMINPNIKGKEYQEGSSYRYYNIRYYVFARDKYTCQVCKKKGKILQTHHIIYKSKGGTDRANNLITVCTDCHNHKNHQEGEIFYKWMINKKKMPSYKEMPFMNIIRKRVFKKYPDANITYGNITTPKRKKLGLEKTHYNDALVISGIEEVFIDNVEIFRIKQFRKKKRSLHEATARKGKKNQIPHKKETKKTLRKVKVFI